MILPPTAQTYVDELRAVLGAPPASQITVHVDQAGVVRCVDVRISYRPPEKPVDNPPLMGR